MSNKTFEDTFEKLAEQGTTAAKKAVKSGAKQLAGTVSVTKMWEQLLGVNPSQSKSFEHLNKDTSNHTPLDFEKLGKHYEKSEAQKTQELRNKLFQLVKEGDEKVKVEKKQEEEERTQKEARELVEKKRKAEEERQRQNEDVPRGKIRRNIFSPKKVAERSHAETKPSTGKQ